MEKKQIFVSRLADQLVKQGAMQEAEAQSLINEFKGRATARIDDILIDRLYFNNDISLEIGDRVQFEEDGQGNILSLIKL